MIYVRSETIDEGRDGADLEVSLEEMEQEGQAEQQAPLAGQHAEGGGRRRERGRVEEQHPRAAGDAGPPGVVGWPTGVPELGVLEVPAPDLGEAGVGEGGQADHGHGRDERRRWWRVEDVQPDRHLRAIERDGKDKAVQVHMYTEPHGEYDDVSFGRLTHPGIKSHLNGNRDGNAHVSPLSCG